MSTQFLRATHKTTKKVIQGIDSDFPHDLFAALKEEEGSKFNPENWNYSLLDYKFDVVQKRWNWKRVWTDYDLNGESIKNEAGGMYLKDLLKK